jgi:hypothetical protein
MAITIGLFGQTGDGKTQSFVVNPDGMVDYNNYQGIEPKSTVIYNCDYKRLPFPSTLGFNVVNSIYTENLDKLLTADAIEKKLDAINDKNPAIKRVIIDTINGLMNSKELLETKKMSYDKWYDLAKDIYSLVVKANSLSRDDLIVYFTGHTGLFEMPNGESEMMLVTNGKKLEKIKIESILPIVIFTRVDCGVNGDNKYYFEVRKNKNSAKSPIGMFDEFRIPNSLKLIDDSVRKFYGIAQ